jgi:NAD(P)-dependent dehydrogenase (short-subunit alcohol dehydrogenase family)
MSQHAFLEGQVCLVTGGAQGLGWALVQALADHGARVHACDISEPSLARAREEARATPWADRLFFERCDVTDRAAFEGWISRVHAREGRVDVLVNNAAFVRWDDVERMTVEDAELTMRVGYDAMVYGTKAVLPLMRAAGRGCIVNVGSIAGRVFVGGSSAAYAAVKAAIDAYTQTLNVELAKTPIYAMVVRPTTIAGTEFFQKHVPLTRMPRLADFVPFLTPPQVAEAIVGGLRRRTKILNVPGSNGAMDLLFQLTPGVFRRLVSIGGTAKKQFGQVKWSYQPKQAGRDRLK